MNKRKLLAQLKTVGVNVQSLDFFFGGYNMKLELDISKGFGWDEFEHTPIDGLEVVKSRQITEYTREVFLIPNNSKEFTNYIQRSQRTYGLSILNAFDDLKSIVETYGSIYAKTNLATYNPFWNTRKKVAR